MKAELEKPFSQQPCHAMRAAVSQCACCCFSSRSTPRSQGPVPPDTLSKVGEIVSNPQAAYTFAGWDQLGTALGLSEESGLRLGGYFISESNWIASGGARPDSVFSNVVLGIHALLDTDKAFHLPGGTLGIEFLESAGGPANPASGTVQQFTTMDWPSPPRPSATFTTMVASKPAR